ncbi:hypothetical protein [Pseudomonas chlororaphis]|uniref:Phage protein n=1 Tax=Pseudomonas chlororaphis TaxID=587753 RepID=A0AAX3G167_9PSED|nr:hypothetical protein [Pseudomonas chlororaphis]AZC35218.1 hypothetical protein C4K37_0809 [Pseudomonas chlororaphis subsp. piscium]AZC41759.1 hypothetical protein C4K36_0812 [Pseudomonas chlororaphis subsp. piscium]WDG73724.1 hypothetical protein PUP65_05010 [Pseudomonas chlororaphis]WDH28639.1 hypothetical protein PUP81_29295 [Pseudomonas chlororaphis]WDH72245.1 hypothetical protein PUP78_05010 [Pseudomonas chlororaphis]
MFNLDEALRNHLAQRQNEPKVRFVAASVATLSPRSKPDKARVVAGVADVATTRKAISSTTALIQWLEEEGAILFVMNNSLYFRPTDGAQLAIVSAHWQALLHDLAAVDQEQSNGSGR